jgi:hypothetical protein
VDLLWWKRSVCVLIVFILFLFQVSGSENFEQLQDLFMEMFESDLNNFHTPAKPSYNKRSRSDFHRGGAVRKEEIEELSFISSNTFHAQSFSLGVSLHVYYPFLFFILEGDPLNNGDQFKVVVGWDYLSRLTREQSFLLNSIF